MSGANGGNEALFPTLSADQMDALRQYGSVVSFDDGQAVFSEGEKAEAVHVILAGSVKVSKKAGRESATLTVHEPGQFAGELSIFSGDINIASGVAVGTVRALRLTADELQRAFSEQPEIKNLMLGAMARRRPEAEAQLLQREKLAALGKLSAGLAHELNNPAAAISRAASQLREVAAGQLARALCLGGCADGFTQAQALVQQLAARVAGTELAQPLSALERSDLEEALAEWLEQQGACEPWAIAPDLVAASIGTSELQSIANSVPSAKLTDVAAWLAGAVGTLSLVAQIENSSFRLSEVIGAIKSYTYMDQAPVQQVDIIAGLETTLTLLRHKLKSVTIAREFQADLPAVSGRGGLLNQVWTNLIDNAVDAMDGVGTLTLVASSDARQVTVKICDTGSGISPEVQPHIFEPFYTTKPQGHGTGLGLDAAYHIVVDEHHGEIAVSSQPGATTFTVRLPIQSPDQSKE